MSHGVCLGFGNIGFRGGDGDGYIHPQHGGFMIEVWFAYFIGLATGMALTLLFFSWGGK